MSGQRVVTIATLLHFLPQYASQSFPLRAGLSRRARACVRAPPAQAIGVSASRTVISSCDRLRHKHEKGLHSGLTFEVLGTKR